MTTRRLVLATTSPYRRALLETIGVRFLVESPLFEEDHGRHLDPATLAIAFARGKAESLAARFPDAVIVGADQVPELEGRILGKPGSEGRAIEQLLALQGRTHRLITAVAVHDAARKTTEHRAVVHAMRMRPLSRATIEAYVARDRPLDCAGSYRVEARGALLFEEMCGADHTAIVGLPLTVVADLLARVGVDLLHEALST
jgi:septum formation protein